MNSFESGLRFHYEMRQKTPSFACRYSFQNFELGAHVRHLLILEVPSILTTLPMVIDDTNEIVQD